MTAIPPVSAPPVPNTNTGAPVPVGTPPAVPPTGQLDPKDSKPIALGGPTGDALGGAQQLGMEGLAPILAQLTEMLNQLMLMIQTMIGGSTGKEIQGGGDTPPGDAIGGGMFDPKQVDQSGPPPTDLGGATEDKKPVQQGEPTDLGGATQDKLPKDDAVGGGMFDPKQVDQDVPTDLGGAVDDKKPVAQQTDLGGSQFDPKQTFPTDLGGAIDDKKPVAQQTDLGGSQFDPKQTFPTDLGGAIDDKPVAQQTGIVGGGFDPTQVIQQLATLQTQLATALGGSQQSGPPFGKAFGYYEPTRPGKHGHHHGHAFSVGGAGQTGGSTSGKFPVGGAGQIGGSQFDPKQTFQTDLGGSQFDPKQTFQTDLGGSQFDPKQTSTQLA